MPTIELFGVPRLKAGGGRFDCDGRTVGEALQSLATICPGLAGSVIGSGRVLPSYILSINGDRFVSDPATPLDDGDVLLLLSADVGG